MPYPPGAKNDPRAPYNQEDHTHEHRWRHEEERLQPVIEDGAAIFFEECTYVEGRWGQGWECEETRTYRFEYARLTVKSGMTTAESSSDSAEYDTLVMSDGEEYDVPTIDEWDTADPEVRDRVVEIEQAFHEHGPGDDVSFDVDPHPEDGEVSIGYDGYTLHYRP